MLRLAQVQDNLVDLRRLRQTLRSLRTYFKSNVVGEGQKTQTKSRTVKSGVNIRIAWAVRRYRLAYAALLSLDPGGDWRKEYRELTDKDNRRPGKELYEQGVGDGHYAMSWIWGGSFGDEAEKGADSAEREEVNETVRHEWMTCRARADRWREESDLLQEEMHRVIAFLEWKSCLWGRNVGSCMDLVTADIQHGIDGYARKQASVYHELAVSLANQWIPHLLALKLDISWAKTYSWAAKFFPPTVDHPPGPSNPHENSSPGNPPSLNVTPPPSLNVAPPPSLNVAPPPSLNITPPSLDITPPPSLNVAPPPSLNVTPPGEKRANVIKLMDLSHGSEDESDDGSDREVDREDGSYSEGEKSDGLGMGFEYDDEYMR